MNRSSLFLTFICLFQTNAFGGKTKEIFEAIGSPSKTRVPFKDCSIQLHDKGVVITPPLSPLNTYGLWVEETYQKFALPKKKKLTLGHDCTTGHVAAILIQSPSRPYKINISTGKSVTIHKGYVLIDSQEKADFFLRDRLLSATPKKIVLKKGLLASPNNKDLLIITESHKKTFHQLVHYDGKDLNFLQCNLQKIAGSFTPVSLNLFSPLPQGHQSINCDSFRTLTTLNLYKNKLGDIDFISQLTSLSFLGLGHNQIKNLKPLSVLPGLKALGLKNNLVEDLSPLSPLIQLKELYLNGNNIHDASPLSALTQLTELYLHGNHIKSIAFITTLTSLTSLNLSGNQIQDATPLSHLTFLTFLGLHQNRIKDISFISSLISLSTLDLDNNDIEDITPLSALVSLTSLSLNKNRIKKIEPLSTLIALKSLSLQNNEVEDATPLSHLTSLITLDVAGNRIQSILPFMSLTSLLTLNFNDNPVKDIERPHKYFIKRD